MRSLMPRLRLLLHALLVCLVLTSWATPAHALPGPELLVPIAVGATHLFFHIAAFLGSLLGITAARDAGGRKLVAVLVIALLLRLGVGPYVMAAIASFFLIASGVAKTSPSRDAYLAAMLRGAWSAASSRRKPLLALLALLLAILMFGPGGPVLLLASIALVLSTTRRRRLLVTFGFMGFFSGLFAASLLLSKPLPELPPLPLKPEAIDLPQQQTRVSISLGEYWQFLACRPRSDYRLRNQDLADSQPALRHLLARGMEVELLVADASRLDLQQRELSSLGVRIRTAPTDGPQQLCYQPFAAVLLEMLVPANVVHLLFHDFPGLSFENAKIIRGTVEPGGGARSLVLGSAGAVTSLSTREIVELVRRAGPREIVVQADVTRPQHAATALRLLKRAGAGPLRLRLQDGAAPPGNQFGPALPWSSFLWLLLSSLLVSVGLEALLNRLRIRSEAKFLAGGLGRGRFLGWQLLYFLLPLVPMAGRGVSHRPGQCPQRGGKR